MSIGSVPANSTKAGATEFTLTMDIRVWELTQITSWWPGAGAFVPGSSVATSFELWYKFKLPAKFYAYYTTIGVTVQNIGNTGYSPSVNDASLCYVRTEFDEDLLYAAGRGQVHTNRNTDKYYYIQVITPNQNRVAETRMKIRVDTFERKISNVGAIAVQDSHQWGAIVVANPITTIPPNSNADVAQIWVSEDAHSLGGTCGDILSISGVTCIQDSALAGGGVTLRSRNYRDPVSFPNMLVSLIARDSAGTTFWIHWNDLSAPDGPALIRSIHVGAGGTSTAVLGPVIQLNRHPYNDAQFSSTKELQALRVHNNFAYYTFLNSNTIYKCNLATNEITIFLPEVSILRWTGGAGYFPDNTLYYGRVMDILILPNGDVLAAHYDDQPADERPADFPFQTVYRPFSIRKYNSAGTFLASYLNLAVQSGAPLHHRINYTEDPNTICVWTHFTNSGYPSSGFGRVRASDGVLQSWTFAHEFLQGAMLYTGSLYTGTRTPAQSWGTNQRHNFWINPLDVAIPAIPVDPVDPPPPGPGEPIPNPAGGGLLMLDPSNLIRHDIYMDKTGAQYNSTINVTIGTAYIGD